MTAWKLTGQTSCARCKYLYLTDSGYSNYTVENTSVSCALDKNPKIPYGESTEYPHDWRIYSDGHDPWSVTNQSRCEEYEAIGPDQLPCHLDVDGETTPEDSQYKHLGTQAIQAIAKHSGRFKQPPVEPDPEPSKEELMAERVRIKGLARK